METFICARNECQKEVERRTFNQKFCSNECLRIETNRKIMERYYDNRARRQGKTRLCKECNTTKLSRYNESLICSACSLKNEVNANEEVMNMLLSL